MDRIKAFYLSRTLWALGLHLIAAAFAYFGIDVTLAAFDTLPDGGLTLAEIMQVVTVLLAAWYRWKAQTILSIKQ